MVFLTEYKDIFREASFVHIKVKDAVLFTRYIVSPLLPGTVIKHRKAFPQGENAGRCFELGDEFSSQQDSSISPFFQG